MMKTVIAILSLLLSCTLMAVTVYSTNCDSIASITTTNTTYNTTNAWTGTGSCRGQPSNTSLVTAITPIAANFITVTVNIKIDNAQRSATTAFQHPKLRLSDGSLLSYSTLVTDTNLRRGARGTLSWRQRSYRYNINSYLGKNIDAVVFSTKSTSFLYFEDLNMDVTSASGSFLNIKNSQNFNLSFSAANIIASTQYNHTFSFTGRFTTGSSITIATLNEAEPQELYMSCESVQVQNITNVSPAGATSLTATCLLDWTTHGLAPFIVITNNSGRELLNVDFNLSIFYTLKISEEATAGIFSEVFEIIPDA